MKGFIALFSVLCLCHAVSARPGENYGRADEKVEDWLKKHPKDENMKNVNKTLRYLNKFGYTPEKGDVDFTTFSEAVRQLQKTLRLPQTGELDSTTMTRMLGRRCGVSDRDMVAKRGKRASVGGTRWRSRYLTYKILNYSPDMSVADIDRVIEAAFELLPFCCIEIRAGKVSILGMRLEMEYAEDVDFIDEENSLLDALLPIAASKLKIENLFMNESKTEFTHIYIFTKHENDDPLRGGEPWRISKILGSLLCSTADIASWGT